MRRAVQGRPAVSAVRFRDPDGGEVFTIERMIGPNAVAIHAHPRRERALVVLARLQGLVFEKYGRHTLTLVIDDTEIAARPVAVVPEDSQHHQPGCFAVGFEYEREDERDSGRRERKVWGAVIRAPRSRVAP